MSLRAFSVQLRGGRKQVGGDTTGGRVRWYANDGGTPCDRGLRELIGTASTGCCYATYREGTARLALGRVGRYGWAGEELR